MAGAGRAARAPGACEGTGEGGGRGAAPGRGCVGGGGPRCLLHPESAGRSRLFGPAGWSHSACSSNLTR